MRLIKLTQMKTIIHFRKSLTDRMWLSSLYNCYTIYYKYFLTLSSSLHFNSLSHTYTLTNTNSKIENVSLNRGHDRKDMKTLVFSSHTWLILESFLNWCHILSPLLSTVLLVSMLTHSVCQLQSTLMSKIRVNVKISTLMTQPQKNINL